MKQQNEIQIQSTKVYTQTVSLKNNISETVCV